MRLLITGGAGFIGSALCRNLVERNSHDVLNIDKLTYAANLHSLESASKAPNYRFLRGDICDRDMLDSAFAQFRPTGVIHLAAESHVDRSISGSDTFIRTNIHGTYTLLEAARAYWTGLADAERQRFRFVHVSTDEVYGSLDHDASLFAETSAYDPSSPYSASKAAGDHLVMAWYRTYGFPAIISNCSNNYGPFQFPEKLIPLMILNALRGAPLPVYGDGLNVRDWLYVGDHVSALQHILERGQIGQKYNVGGRNERSNLQVVETICARMDEIFPERAPHADLISFVTDRPGHDKRYAIDAGKLESELGWQAAETFDTGIRKTVDWYLANRQWWEPLTTGVYGGERLGLERTDTKKESAG